MTVFILSYKTYILVFRTIVSNYIKYLCYNNDIVFDSMELVFVNYLVVCSLGQKTDLFTVFADVE